LPLFPAWIAAMRCRLLMAHDICNIRISNSGRICEYLRRIIGKFANFANMGARDAKGLHGRAPAAPA
ncbi:MAG TPA: hypothetical protein VFF94_15660, partial [Novosphingobium sp.]|nr:hypothetical protein [Novosphingobium sp.]